MLILRTPFHQWARMNVKMIRRIYPWTNWRFPVEKQAQLRILGRWGSLRVSIDARDPLNPISSNSKTSISTTVMYLKWLELQTFQCHKREVMKNKKRQAIQKTLPWKWTVILKTLRKIIILIKKLKKCSQRIAGTKKSSDLIWSNLMSWRLNRKLSISKIIWKFPIDYQ